MLNFVDLTGINAFKYDLNVSLSIHNINTKLTQRFERYILQLKSVAKSLRTSPVGILVITFCHHFGSFFSI